MPHNFQKSLAYENSKTSLADSYYFNQLHIEKIIRFNSGSGNDMVFQRRDIDLQLYGWNKHTNVSEKFRDFDFNDLYLELYSMYPEVKGWMHKSEANYLAYFFPKRMIWIDKKDLISIFKKYIEPNIIYSDLNVWLANNKNKSGKYKTEIEVLETNYPVLVINAFNKTANKEWNTVGVSVPFNLLKTCGLVWKEYQYKDENRF